MKNIIFVDVDGVLFPFTSNPPKQYKAFQVTPYKEVILNPNHGQWLLDLATETDSELVWLTYWCDEANQYIGPLIGLPQLPVAEIHHWKFSGPVSANKALSAQKYAGNRNFAQFDDESSVAYYLKFFKVPREQGKHVQVGPNMGLSRNHIRAARNFLLTRDIVQ